VTFEEFKQLYQSCMRKKAYATRDRAEVQVGIERRKRGSILFVYPCRYCMKWHLTHKPQYRKATNEIPSDRNRSDFHYRRG
jgi:hypothetical protein